MSPAGAAGSCALLLLAHIPLSAPAAGQAQGATQLSSAPVSAGPAAVLDVPFVPQSPALCGGAAVAMVLRYFGERGVYAEDFASLVVETGEGIRTDDLAVAVRQRGWQAVSFAGDAQQVQHQLAQGRPVIALIEVRPQRYHYVVVVAWRDGVVVLHDPADGPLRRFDETRFERAWAATSRWAMLVLPGTAARAATEDAAAADDRADPAAAAPATPAYAPADACDASLDAAVHAARSTDFAAAEHALRDAAALCADPSVAHIELAALRFQQQRYAEAARLAETVVAGDSDNATGWDLLASSRYLLDDADGALRAWNRVGRPRNDLTRIDGLSSTQYQLVYRAIDIAGGAIVTNAALARARRRVTALPTVLRARVDYRPVRGGDIEVHAAIAERPVLPLSLGDLLAHGVRALADDRLRIDVASAVASGEAWLLDWVWPRNRRAFELGFATPGAFGAGGVWQLHVADRTVTFRTPATGVGADSAGTIARENHRAATMTVSDWLTGAIHWRLSGSIAKWSGRGGFAGVLGQVGVRSWRDRVAVRVGRGGWWSLGGSDAFHTSSLDAAVRSVSTPAAFEWSARSGIAFASDNAPRSRWSGAGNDFGSHALLRAHALNDGDGITTGAFFGPRLVHGGIELRRWVQPFGPVQLGAAAFADAAHVHAVANDQAARTALDIGAGIRLRIAGLAGAIRADAALGVVDGASALSLGWTPPWPAW